LAPGDIAGAVADHLHVDALIPRLLLGEPHRRELRLGEHDGRDGAMVGPRQRGRTVQDRVAGDARLVLAHVGEEVAPVDVADGVEPVAVDTGGA